MCAGNRLSGKIPKSLWVPPNKNPTTIVSSSPSSMSKTPASASTTSNKSHGKGSPKISPVAFIAIIVCNVFVLAIVSLLLYCYFWRNYKLKKEKGSKLFESEKIVYSSSHYPA